MKGIPTSRQSANLRAAATKNGYQIDLGGSSVYLTGKQWTIEPAHSGAFLRPIANRPLPQPTHSEKPLPEHLRIAFGLKDASPKEEDPAKALPNGSNQPSAPARFAPRSS